LYERDYHAGVIALINSLIKNDFEGIIVVGTRGAPHEVLLDMADTISDQYATIDICFRSIESERHLARCKPDFMRCVWEQRPTADRIFYADPDLLFKAAWPNFEQWADCGVSLCEDANSPVYRHHPRRHVWKDTASTHGLNWENEFDVYFNSGFVGLTQTTRSFLSLWSKVIDICCKQETFDERFARRELSPLHPFQTWDQDALNIAACCYDGAISFMGKEGMDFKHGGQWMSHAIGARKPWSAQYVRDAVQGNAPRQVDRLYWRNFQNPFPTVEFLSLWKKKMCLNISILISKLI
jgi:hypothetical protein